MEGSCNVGNFVYKCLTCRAMFDILASFFSFFFKFSYNNGPFMQSCMVDQQTCIRSCALPPKVLRCSIFQPKIASLKASWLNAS
ncbi:hypothetical protein HanRHA438_Chr02g0089141 [Helianthus annuus]|nr:hypothetical protein HanRHA438_Chr02g0089141 [Helianthus annuus]